MDDELKGLVLTRKVGEKIWIADLICIEVDEVKGQYVRLRFKAPFEIPIMRDEIRERMKRE